MDLGKIAHTVKIEVFPNKTYKLRIRIDQSLKYEK